MDVFESIVNMTNKEAANVLRHYTLLIIPARGNGKTIMNCAYRVAMAKAIQLLATTPDEEEPNESL